LKILFDHGTPRPLRRELSGHSVDTAADKGWDRLANGDLIDIAEQDGYEILITTDQNMRHQQSLTCRRLAIIVLLSGAWPYTKGRIEDIRATIAEVQPGDLREVYIPMRGER
jgi:hypothetical protein